MKEDDDKTKKSGKITVKKGKEKEGEKPKENIFMFEEKDMESYLSHDWEKMRNMEYYKHFFQYAELNNVLTLALESEFDKKKKKQAKKKKKKNKTKNVEDDPTLAEDLHEETCQKGFDVFEDKQEKIIQKESPKTAVEPILHKDSSEKSEQSDNPEDEINEKPVETIENTEISNKNDEENEIENELETEKIEISEEAKIETEPKKINENAENLESPEITENNEPEQKNETEKEPQNKEKTKPQNKKKKQKQKKPDTAYEQAIKAQYEAQKESALKMFSDKLGANNTKSKNESKKKRKKKKKQALQQQNAQFEDNAIVSSIKQKTDEIHIEKFAAMPSKSIEPKAPSESNPESTTPSVETSTRKMSANSCASTGSANHPTGSQRNTEPEMRWRKHSGDFKERKPRGFHYNALKETATQTNNAPTPYVAWNDPLPVYQQPIMPPIPIVPQPMFIYVPFYLDPKLVQISNILNLEIDATLSRLEAHNKLVRPVCDLVQSNIFRVASNTFPKSENMTTAMYGSMATGLALPYSDVDIAVLNAPYDSSLELLGCALQQEKFVKECKVISTARVPVIKLVVNLAKLGVTTETPIGMEEMKVDVTLDTMEKPTLENEEQKEHRKVSLVKNGVSFVEWAHQRMREVPALKPVALIMKMILANNKLNIPYHGNFLRRNNNRWYGQLCNCHYAISIS